MSDLFNRLRHIVKTAIVIFGLDPQLPHDFVRACPPQIFAWQGMPFRPSGWAIQSGFRLPGEQYCRHVVSNK
jgi:hypothetical protein